MHSPISRLYQACSGFSVFSTLRLISQQNQVLEPVVDVVA